MLASGFNHMLSVFSFKNFNGKSLTQCYATRYYCFAPLVLLLLFSCVFSGGVCGGSTTASVPLGFVLHAYDRDKYWLSENGAFTFGFLEIAGDEFVVGIKYNLGDRSVNLPVWTVGAGLRVAANASFSLAMDGRFVLMKNPSGIILWSSNTSNLDVQKATLLNNGNLVLLSGKDEVLWESFSSPTNTLLPGQTLRYPQSLRALSTRSISSYYSLVISPVGELELVWEHNVTYWRSRFSSKEARFESSGFFALYDDRHRTVWSVSPIDYEDTSVSLRHLRIDRDGNLRIYSWDDKSHTWKGVWQAVQDQCNVFGSCGLFSVCGYNSSGPVCECLSPDPSDMGVSNAADSGCRRLVDLSNCKMHSSMFTMKQTVLYGLYPSHDNGMFLSEPACREYCSNDTTCIAATSMNDGSGLCTIKRTSFLSGFKTPYIHAVSFLKVCSVPQAAATEGNNKGHGNRGSDSFSGLSVGRPSMRTLIGAIALIALLTVSVILSIQVLLFWLLYRRRNLKARARIPFGKDTRMNPHYSILIRLSYEEIKEVTNDFAVPLGTSAFKGVLPNKAPVVVKRIKGVAVSEKEFRIAIATLNGTHHRNLASVKGFCYEPANKLLVYEYVPNGSLDEWILGTKEDQSGYVWQKKLEIVLGVARAIAYLHTECQKCITHGSLKLENILLDENMVAKVTNFGVEDLVMKQTAAAAAAAASASESPSERDIFMLGLVFLQIVTQKREVVGENVQQVLERANQQKLGSSSDSLQGGIERITRISFWCMQDQPFLRPSIGEVVKVLEGTLSVDRPPSCSARTYNGVMIDTTEEIESEC
ncbi:G-type lectin S-receptor-like serine/threonine-protein kinase SD3-1 [Andrographis paniculata]|uniref:G-type lectin S-receptor-like serine/threonine-protein kinase SD3-1 n=1 Tax=Andrographis paniculata TaxID=175694 RepID=UPI0021E89256|nr:G-type lectin S-receptor-like serine/threonine-protein kinase SD3-1 [Andrographis paniculata]